MHPSSPLTTPKEHAEVPANAGAACNIASYLPRMAASVPDQAAVIVPRSRNRAGKAVYDRITFVELEALSNRYANALVSTGIERGMRVLLMVRPGFDFVGLTFALFKMGAVPVMIDPGMGVNRMLVCMRTVDLHAFVGIPLAQLMRVVRREAFRSVRHVVTVGRRWCWGGPTLKQLTRRASAEFTPVETKADETAAILFTSGSTGPAKGVVYAHGMFDAQVRMIQTHYGIEPGEVDLPALPLFALFSTAMGMTCVIPDMDPSHPARVDPARFVQAIQDHQVTNTFGSPAIWRRVGDYCHNHGITLPSLRRILIAGAPVAWQIIDQLRDVLVDDADVHTPYGATEALPVSSICGREVLETCRPRTVEGAGTCVGRPLTGIDLRIIRIDDAPIERFSDDLLVDDDEVGEIVVAGDVVTKAYYGLPEATASAKILDEGRIWHRIGDVGHRDRDGRIWFCGRKSQRVTTPNATLFADQCEAVFNEHPDVYRSALVGVGDPGQQTPVLVVEPIEGRFPKRAQVFTFWEELREIGQANPLTSGIEIFLFHPSLPVDIRHNTKIDREALAAWAAAEL